MKEICADRAQRSAQLQQLYSIKSRKKYCVMIFFFLHCYHQRFWKIFEIWNSVVYYGSGVQSQTVCFKCVLPSRAMGEPHSGSVPCGIGLASVQHSGGHAMAAQQKPVCTVGCTTSFVCIQGLCGCGPLSETRGRFILTGTKGVDD